jgi:hypothetical protein
MTRASGKNTILKHFLKAYFSHILSAAYRFIYKNYGTLLLWFAIGFIASFFWFSKPGFIEKFQTLMAGIIAFVGAFLTVCIMIKHDKERKQREFDAAMIDLPQTASDICQYTEEVIEYLLKMLPPLNMRSESYTIEPQAALNEVPRLEKSVSLTLKNLASTAKEGNAANDYLRVMSRDLQILSANIETLARFHSNNPRLSERNKIVLPINIQAYLFRTIRIYAKAANLFYYHDDMTGEFAVENRLIGSVTNFEWKLTKKEIMRTASLLLCNEISSLPQLKAWLEN